MVRTLASGIVALSVVTFGLSMFPGAQAGPVCANNEPDAPEDCVLELKGYGSWGVCIHAFGDYCPAYVDGAGRLCSYANGDLACAPFGSIVGPTVCANNAPNAPDGCVIELKGYGSWGACIHAFGDYCPAYVDGAGRLCSYANGDLACVPLL